MHDVCVCFIFVIWFNRDLHLHETIKRKPLYCTSELDLNPATLFKSFYKMLFINRFPGVNSKHVTK